MLAIGEIVRIKPKSTYPTSMTGSTAIVVKQDTPEFIIGWSEESFFKYPDIEPCYYPKLAWDVV